MIRITSKKAGFRRCGIPHSAEPKGYDGVFNRKQIEALKAEPKLLVEEIPDAKIPDAKIPDTNKPPGKKKQAEG